MSNHRKLTMDDIKQMEPDEINERWDEITPVLYASGVTDSTAAADTEANEDDAA